MDRREEARDSVRKKGVAVILLTLVAVALFFGWLFLHFQRLRRNDPWQRFRLLHRARLQRPLRERTIDPTFQFDPPPQSPDSSQE
jgi:hypothetical protein